MKRKAFVLLIVSVMVLSVAAPAIASPSDDFDFANSDVPNPRLDVDTLTVAKHPMDKGTSADAMAGYFDDNGDWVSNPQFVVNTTSSVANGLNVNPYSFKPGHIEEPSYDEFPDRGDAEDAGSDTNQASFADSSEWSANQGSSNVTLSDTTVAQNVDAVRIDTTGTSNVDSADTVAEVGYANWTSQYDSDESKRVLQVAMDVDTIDSSGRLNLSVIDDTGDWKEVIIEPDETNKDVNASVMATGTGDHVYQVKLSALTTNGGGSWDNIESVNVTAEGANIDVSISWISLERKGKTILGKKKVDDADSDSDFDNTNTTYNATGRISVKGMDTLDPMYDDATITDVQFPAQFSAAQMQGAEGENKSYVVYWKEASAYPSYDHVLNVSYRLEAPAAIDLSYSGVDLDFPQEFPSGRYIEARFESAVGNNSNLSQSSWTDQTGSLASTGDIINFVGASSDTHYAVNFEVKLTEDERNAIEGASTAGAGQFEEDSGGGIVDTIIGLPGMVVGIILTFLGLRRRGG